MLHLPQKKLESRFDTNKKNPHGLIASIPTGGRPPPTLKAGDADEVKKKSRKKRNRRYDQKYFSHAQSLLNRGSM